MLRPASLCLSLGLLTGLAQANWSFRIPAGTYTDSAAVNAAIPCRTFSDSLTTTSLSMTNKTMRLGVTWGALPNLGAKAGVQLPFNDRWTGCDMSEVTAVSFFYKTSDTKTGVQFAPSSDLYPGSASSDGVMLAAVRSPSVDGRTTVVGLPTGISYLKWMVDEHREETLLTWDDVKADVKGLEFQPLGAYYEGTSDTVTAPTAWIEVSDIVVRGNFIPGSNSANWLSKFGTGCTGARVFQLDRFEAGSAQNAQGGNWYTFTDSLTTGKAGGQSFIKNDASTNQQGIEFIPNDGTMDADLAGITATLDKGDATLHPKGGWAGIGTAFESYAGCRAYLDLVGLKAFSFDLHFGEDFDTANIAGVNFKIGNDPNQVPDSVAFYAGITPAQVGGLGKGSEICIDMDQLRQPQAASGLVNAVPTWIGKFDWELRLKDGSSRSLPSSFYLGSFRLWGMTPGNEAKACTDAILPSQRQSTHLTARYSNALLLSYDLPGASSAKIQVLRLDGSKVASFDGAAKAYNQSFSANLAHGTYLAVVQGGSHKFVAPFAVTR